MSFNLEFYAISWDEVSTAIGCKDRRLFRRILQDTESYFEEVFDPEAFEGGPDFELGLERWLEGEVESPLKGETVAVDNLGDALGFVALTRFYGQLVGTVNHSASSGEAFRKECLLGAVQRLLEPPYTLENLLSRPILGYESDDFPFWGGLTRAELRMVADSIARDAPRWEADSDVDAWMLDVWNGLRESVEANKDLITIYA